MILNIKKQCDGLYTVDGLRFESLASARDYATCMAKAKGCGFSLSPECMSEMGSFREAEDDG